MAKETFEPTDLLDPNQGFRGWTPRARNVVMAAQNEARAAANREIGTEHLVLGLLAEPDAIAARVIVELGVPLEQVREAATAALPPAANDVPPLIPFDRNAAKVLQLTFREALRLGHNYVGTEHILLALLELENGEGVLSDLGIHKVNADARIVAALIEVMKAKA